MTDPAGDDRRTSSPTGTSGRSTRRAATSTSRGPGPAHRAASGWTAAPPRRRRHARRPRADAGRGRSSAAAAPTSRAARSRPARRRRTSPRASWRSPSTLRRPASTSSRATPRSPPTAATRAQIRAAGFHPIEEIQPSRHRIVAAARRRRRGGRLRGDREVDPPADPEGREGRDRRRPPRRAARAGRGGGGLRGAARADRHRPRPLLRPPARDRRAAAVLVRAARVVRRLVARRPSRRPPRPPRGALARRATPLAGLLLYRHGERLSTVHSGDHETARRDHPGALHLLRWRAIQLAIREGRDGDGPRRRRRRRRAARAARGRADVRPLPAQALVRGRVARAHRGAREGDPAEPLPGRRGSRRGSSRDPAPASGAAEDDRERRRSTASSPPPSRRAAAARRAHRPPRRRERPAAGARDGGKAIGPAALARAAGPRRDATTRAGSRPAACSSRFAATHVDGHDLVATRRPAGAVAAIVERAAARRRSAAGRRRPRRAAALADAAAWWYGDPSHELGVVGITGTDGKTTTSFLAVAALEAAGLSTGCSARSRRRSAASREPNPEHMTTPGAPELQRALRAMVDGGQRGRGRRDHLARARGRSRPGHRLRRRDPHEPHPRAPRVPRVVGGVPRREAVAVRAARRSRAARTRARRRRRRPGRRPRSSTSTTRTAGVFVGVAQEAGARIVTYGTDPAADVRATHSRGGRARGSASRTRRRRARPPRAPARRPLQRPQRARGRRARRGPRPGSGRGPGRARVGRGGARAGWSASTPASRSASSIDYAHSPASLEAVLESSPRSRRRAAAA